MTVSYTLAGIDPRTQGNPIMNFRADNEAPVAEPILQAIIDANSGSEYAYGGDTHTAQLNNLFSELFDCYIGHQL